MTGKCRFDAIGTTRLFRGQTTMSKWIIDVLSGTGVFDKIAPRGPIWRARYPRICTLQPRPRGYFGRLRIIKRKQNIALGPTLASELLH